ncbi:MAG: hypothetical protein HC888_13140, partial [Candidatus Competibacteraceae bacterium]|nr:hypothetical protein [Candidatus Competibacteraceae bacterium]
MIQNNRFREDMLDFETQEAASDTILIAGPATAARVDGAAVVMDLSLFTCKRGSFEADGEVPPRTTQLRVQAWGDCIVRLTLSFGQIDAFDDLDSSPMIARDPALVLTALSVRRGSHPGDYSIVDGLDRVVMKTAGPRPPSHPWSGLQPEPPPVFDAVVHPDRGIGVPFMAHDTFFPAHRESVGLG